MFKQICLLIITSFFCACVATKPVATETMFHSEWNPVLTIQIPEGFSQFGPYIVDGKERKSGFVREEHYPYIEWGDDDSVFRIISITILAFGHRKRWEIGTEGELDKVSVAGGVTTIENKPIYNFYTLTGKGDPRFYGKTEIRECTILFFLYIQVLHNSRRLETTTNHHSIRRKTRRKIVCENRGMEV